MKNFESTVQIKSKKSFTFLWRLGVDTKSVRSVRKRPRPKIVAQRRIVVAFGLALRPRILNVSTVSGMAGGPGRETQKCRHFWACMRSSHPKSVNNLRDRGGPGGEMQNGRYVWTRVGSLLHQNSGTFTRKSTRYFCKSPNSGSCPCPRSSIQLFQLTKRIYMGAWPTSMVTAHIKVCRYLQCQCRGFTTPPWGILVGGGRPSQALRGREFGDPCSVGSVRRRPIGHNGA